MNGVRLRARGATTTPRVSSTRTRANILDTRGILGTLATRGMGSMGTASSRGGGGGVGVATELAIALDPTLMMQTMGMQADPWQARFLRSNAPRVLLNVHRQAGKSTVVGVTAVHTALFRPDSLVLILSPGLRQSGELFRKCVDAYHASGCPVPANAENKLTLELQNGSRIVSLPGTEGTVRGYSGVQLLIIDEAARVPDELYMSVRPMLAVSAGRLLALSTPFGTRGWWYEAWRSEEAWERYQIPASECPRISPEFLEEERRTMGSYWFNQEYQCAFASAETHPFTQEDVDRAFAEESEAWGLGPSAH